MDILLVIIFYTANKERAKYMDMLGFNLQSLSAHYHAILIYFVTTKYINIIYAESYYTIRKIFRDIKKQRYCLDQ